LSNTSGETAFFSTEKGVSAGGVVDRMFVDTENGISLYQTRLLQKRISIFLTKETVFLGR